MSGAVELAVAGNNRKTFLLLKIKKKIVIHFRESNDFCPTRKSEQKRFTKFA